MSPDGIIIIKSSLERYFAFFAQILITKSTEVLLNITKGDLSLKIFLCVDF